MDFFDSFKNSILSEGMPSAGRMPGFPKTEDDLVRFGVRSFCFMVLLFVLAFDGRSNPLASRGKLGVSMIAGSFVARAAIPGQFSALHVVVACVGSSAVFAVIVSLSVWFQMLKSCAVFLVWVAGTLLLFFVLSAVTLDADELSAWGVWAGGIIEKPFIENVGGRTIE